MLKGVVLLGVIVGASALAAVTSSAAGGGRTFYLAVKPGQCLIAGGPTGNGVAKTVLVVPCSDPAHNFEVYAVRHGGWGYGTMPPAATVTGVFRSLCLSSYQQITGRALAPPGGWYAFGPDAGAEQARYGDKVICSYTHYPGRTGLGAGRHVR